MERIPRKPDSGFKIPVRGIFPIGIAERRRRLIQQRKVRNFSTLLIRNGGHFVAETQVKGQVRAEAIIVLNVGADNALMDAARLESTWYLGRKRGWLVHEKLFQTAERPSAARLR